MDVVAPGRIGRWFSGKVILAYALGAALLLTSAGLLKFLPAASLEDAIFTLRPGSNKVSPEVDRAKVREGLAKLPAILAKLGFALLGVAALARGVRSIEPAGEESQGSGDEDSTRRGPGRVVDWALPGVLAALVFAQVAPSINRPLLGDELENYEQHLRLPLKGTLTTMGGANNQLGYSILAWGSIRAFGDSPSSVRLPALLGAMLLPVVAYRFGLKEFGRAGATILGLLLALWPDGAMAGMQGRSYSLLMMGSVIHIYYFKRFVTSPDRRSAWLYAATLAAACTLHMWFVIVAGAELLFLGLLKVLDRLRPGLIEIRSPLRVETFLLFLTLGGLGAATVQAGILPKFLFILTQKNPTPIDARAVLTSMAECVQGTSFVCDSIPATFRDFPGLVVLRTLVNVVALVGLLACVRGARKDPSARFLLVFFASVALTFFLVVYAQKPVYLYARFFAVLPMILAWAGARGWALLLDPKPAPSSVAKPSNAGTIPA
jgi:Dolichyl-phosphate-mannose-protein mannosyltransferase